MLHLYTFERSNSEDRPVGEKNSFQRTDPKTSEPKQEKSTRFNGTQIEICRRTSLYISIYFYLSVAAALRGLRLKTSPEKPDLEFFRGSFFDRSTLLLSRQDRLRSILLSLCLHCLIIHLNSDETCSRGRSGLRGSP